MNANITSLVVFGLGVVSVVCVGGIIYLSGIGQEPPHSLASIASASVGALVGILATNHKEP